MRMKMSLVDSESLRFLIANNGFSVRGFANYIKISNAYLSDIINQKKEPSASIAGRIANGLNVSVDDIFFAYYVNKSKTKVTEPKKEVTA